jgi:hypothetical protein
MRVLAIDADDEESVIILDITMDILKMLAELRAERERITEAILVVERLAIASGGKRRGRPPLWMSAAKTGLATTTEEPKQRRPFSAATRRKMAAAQKRRWAAKKTQPKAA